MVDKKMEDLEIKYYLTWQYIMAWLKEFPGIQTPDMVEVIVIK